MAAAFVSALHVPAVTFKYTTLSGGYEQDKIRLFRLHPGAFLDPVEITLFEVDFGKHHSYTALSYVWGTMTQDNKIICNGKVLYVTESLEAALRRVRQNHRYCQHVWADAICIDQTDLAERRHQVSLMGKIYSSATAVCAYLGEELPSIRTEHILKMMDVCAKVGWRIRDGSYHEWLFTAYGLHQYMNDDDVDKCARLIVDRAYFRRIWVRQECVLADSLHFRIGRHIWHRIYFENFIYGFRLLWMRRKGPRTQISTDGSEIVPELIAWSLDLLSIKPSNWIDILNRSLGCVASDPRDSVYGLLELSTSPYSRSIEADYTLSVLEVFRNSTRTVITGQRKLSILNMMAGSESRLNTSWALNFAQYIPWDPYFHTDCNATFDTLTEWQDVGDDSILRLKGACVGSVSWIITAETVQKIVRHERGYAQDCKKLLLQRLKARPGSIFDGLFESQMTIDWAIESIAQAILIADRSWESSEFCFVTDTGLLGIVAWPVRVDDKIVLLRGGDTPFYLQAKPSDGSVRRFEFGRECYVPGLMNGEGMNRELKWEWFDLT